MLKRPTDFELFIPVLCDKHRQEAEKEESAKRRKIGPEKCGEIGMCSGELADCTDKSSDLSNDSSSGKVQKNEIRAVVKPQSQVNALLQITFASTAAGDSRRTKVQTEIEKRPIVEKTFAKEQRQHIKLKLKEKRERANKVRAVVAPVENARETKEKQIAGRFRWSQEVARTTGQTQYYATKAELFKSFKDYCVKQNMLMDSYCLLFKVPGLKTLFARDCVPIGEFSKLLEPHVLDLGHDGITNNTTSNSIWECDYEAGWKDPRLVAAVDSLWVGGGKLGCCYVRSNRLDEPGVL